MPFIPFFSDFLSENLCLLFGKKIKPVALMDVKGSLFYFILFCQLMLISSYISLFIFGLLWRLYLWILNMELWKVTPSWIVNIIFIFLFILYSFFEGLGCCRCC